MDVRIRNVAGVESADFALSAISLIAGQNAAGKSSLIDAIAAAVTQEPFARGVTKKKDLRALLRDGADAGSVTLSWDENSAVRVMWPDGDVQTRGTPRFLGTALGTGALRWSQIDGKRRATELTERLALEPTKDDLTAYLKEREASEVTIEAVWGLVEKRGWDPAHKQAQEKAKAARAKWEEVAETPFGAQKSNGWRPNVLERDETYEVDACAAALQAARDSLEALLKAGAVAEDERRRVEAVAATLGDAQAAEEAARAKHAQADKALDKAETDLANTPPVEGPPGSFLSCPHCNREVVFKPAAPDRLARLEVPPPPLTAAEIKERRLARQALEQSIPKLKREVDATRDALAAEIGRRERAERAVARLAELKAMPASDEAAMADARAKVSRAEVVLDAVKRMVRATELYREWDLTQPVIAALAPEGVRAARVAAGMGEFNERLAEISAAAKFGAVQIDKDTTEATLAGRPYGLLSESEKWRTDLVVMLALAEREKPAVLLVDRLDILHPQARPPVFEVLRALGIPAVVAYTAKDAATVPPLQRLAYGRSYWMEAGRLAPLG